MLFQIIFPLPVAVTVPSTPSAGSWSETLADRVAAQRQAVRERARQHRSALEHLQSDLQTQLADLRRRNADVDGRFAQSNPSPAAAHAMDWESQKRRMLAMLEAEERSRPGDLERADDRLTIEGTIRITDQMIAEKDQEIAELKRRLAEQTQNLGNKAASALLDADEIVQQERNRLKQLEAELQGKLREAEIDLAHQRAKLARDRVEMEELKRQLETERAKSAPADEQSAARKRAGGNWLTRLGLKTEES